MTTTPDAPATPPPTTPDTSPPDGPPPLRVEFDCTTGATMHIPLTEDELAEQQQRAVHEAAARAGVAAAEQQLAADRATIAAHAATDPVFAAFARLLGVRVDIPSPDTTS